MTVAHRFRIGSCTKTFVAYLATLLIDDLDDIAVGGDVTFRHLLTHRSGLFDATWDGELWEEWLFEPPDVRIRAARRRSRSRIHGGLPRARSSVTPTRT